jgi:hypothetical protein
MGTYTPELGDRVLTPEGKGTITDRDMTYNEALVKLDDGSSILDTTHGRWYPFNELAVIGHDNTAQVWSGQRQVPAEQIVRHPRVWPHYIDHPEF